ncbi:MAG: PAS domain-containing protein [Arcobacteraceae bacterium]|nr:PAS domain-containing protein [Arcobacteraceae bacterium]
MKTAQKILDNYKKTIRSDFILDGILIVFIWHNEATWSVETVSKNIEKYLGYEDELFLNNILSYSSLIHPDDLNRVIEEVSDASSRKLMSFNHEPYRVLTKSNNYIWVKDSTTIIYDENNNITHFIGNVISINDEIEKNLQYQKRLEEQTAELQTIFDTTKDGIAITDLESNFQKVNKAYTKITGLSDEELLKTSCFNLTHPDDVTSTIDKMVLLFKEGHVDNYEKRCLINGKTIVVSISATILPDGNRMLISMKDITRLKTFEEHAKLASMGEMIGNIAHQWRQPLSVITTMASGIQLKKELGMLNENTLDESMDTIAEQANYLSHTIDDFRNFIRNSDEEMPLDIKTTLLKTLSLVSAVLKNHDITVIQNIEDTITIIGHENELIQAFINIINNARDAVEENISNKDDKFIFITTKATDNGVIIEIKDNGGGIPQNIINKIFEPYFTTKHQSIGTGIGLSMTYKILTEHHNGKIEVHNEEYQYNGKNYKGACFTMMFRNNVS